MDITSSRDDRALYDTSKSTSLLDVTDFGSDKDMLKNRAMICLIENTYKIDWPQRWRYEWLKENITSNLLIFFKCEDVLTWIATFLMSELVSAQRGI